MSAAPDGLSRLQRRRLNESLAEWATTIAHVQQFGLQHGLECEVRNPGSPHYQIAALLAPGICLIVYPHKASTGNKHARARDNNSTNKARAADLLGALHLYVKTPIKP